MTRTTIAALAVGGALTLAACSSHSSLPSAGGSGSSAAATSAAAPSATAAASASAPAATASVAPASVAPTSPAAVGTSSAPSQVAAPSVPATVTSPGSTPTATPTTSSKPTAAPTTSVSPVPGARCLNAQLAVSLTPGSPGAGQIYTSLVFTNTSTTPCILSGHPGVSYVGGSDGHQVGTSAARDAGTVTTVTLAPSGTASATLHETNYLDFDQTLCKPVKTEGLRVYPPGSTRSFFVRRPTTQCSATTLPNPALSIGVVKAGSGG